MPELAELLGEEPREGQSGGASRLAATSRNPALGATSGPDLSVRLTGSMFEEELSQEELLVHCFLSFIVKLQIPLEEEKLYFNLS